MRELRSIRWSRGNVIIIDQRLLPRKLKYLKIRTAREMAKAIKDMAIRGAPAIGVAAAMGLALTAYRCRAKSKDVFLERLRRSAEILRATRPTAVNLFWAIERVMKVAEKSETVEEIRRNVINEALRMAEEDVETNKKLGRNGAELVKDGDKILTHCNAGALATVGYGTVLGVIRAAVEQGKNIMVYACETRPKLQGARLTVWELMRDGIKVKLITDNMAAFLMQRGEIDEVIVGADRIVAKTGHVINKIGTLSHAIAAKFYNIPFYVAAPFSSIDFEHNLSEIVIEERDPREVLYVGRERIAPKGAEVWNPAFDITPPELISGIITERGIYRPEELRELSSGVGGRGE
ncbi:MAG TPA: S-methyl-5-thioribose-1-phosphate isomerase [Nitrososphaeria archaeon]|nr:MAG: S-methyl-5-thioribose-1-phosphate isomerase [Nitrososphaerota archaeon]HDJ66797.1 S-methyl-5-thioribose-1-phosphate isomerase [Nitrososphaeria archaeon]